MSVIDTVNAEIEELRATVSREKSYQIKRENYKAIIEHITELQEASEPLPEEAVFSSYDEWKAEVEKDLKAVSSSLSNIDKAKELCLALVTYVEQNPVV